MKKVSGFSLIEVILSGVMVVTTAGALFAVASMSLRLTVQGQDRLVASQLSREGIEVVRQVRDRNFISNICSSTNGCPEWTSGIMSPAAGIQTKHISADPAVGFTLSDVTLTSDQPCSDYIVRSVDETASQPFRTETTMPTLNEGEQLYCRRIYAEYVDLPGTTINDATERQAIRIRSEVAWIGFNKNSLRDPTAGGPGCQLGGGEWCVEDVAILTNWRPSL